MGDSRRADPRALRLGAIGMPPVRAAGMRPRFQGLYLCGSCLTNISIEGAHRR